MQIMMEDPCAKCASRKDTRLQIVGIALMRTINQIQSLLQQPPTRAQLTQIGTPIHVPLIMLLVT
jgi:hypothetical protein